MVNSNSVAARFLLTSLLVGCLTLLLLPVSSAENPKTDPKAAVPGQATAPPTTPVPAPSTRPAPPVQTTQPAVSPVTQAAVQAGVLAGVSRINQVVNFLTANNKSAAFLFVPQSLPDQSVFSVSLGLESLSGSYKYASASFAPLGNGRVGAVYDTVEYVAKTCSEMEKGIFKDLKRKGTLGKDTAILDGGPVTIFLMPAGSGCIVIKKEVAQ
jgi:hypothetical protein